MDEKWHAAAVSFEGIRDGLVHHLLEFTTGLSQILALIGCFEVAYPTLIRNVLGKHMTVVFPRLYGLQLFW